MEVDCASQPERHWPVVRGAIMSILQSVTHTVYRWTQRSRQRQHLAQLDQRLLKDIGIAPQAAQREANKPFWK
jgi:uncharacterized protein YjiS (DUF1127 family)